MALLTVIATVSGAAPRPALSIIQDDRALTWGEQVLVRTIGPGFDDRVGLPNPGLLSRGRHPDGRVEESFQIFKVRPSEEIERRQSSS